MRKLLAVLSFATIAATSNAALTVQDVFTSDEVVWFGLDFTHAKMVGEFHIKPRLLPSWNMLVITEHKKYDIRRAFHKTSVFNDLIVVEKRNAEVDCDKLMVLNDNKLSKETIDEIISDYKGGEKKDGLGLVFIVEQFSRISKRGSFYVTFFDIGSRKVLLAERMEGRPGGFAVRNYWACAIKNVLNQIEETAYAKWKGLYSSPAKR